MSNRNDDELSHPDGDSYSLGSISPSESDSSESGSYHDPLNERVDAENGYLSPHSSSHRGAAVRRRMASNTGDSRYISAEESDGEERSKRKSQRGHKRKNKISIVKFYREHRATFIKCWPTCFLVSCFILWLVVQTRNIYGSISQSTHRPPGSVGRRNRRKRNKPDFLRQPRPRKDSANFFSDAVDGFYDLVHLPGKVLKQVSRGEDLAPGCVRSPWQALNLPNCNGIHETDLREVYDATSKDTGFVGSGYWRHVWLVANRGGDSDTSRTVLKMMKSEHKVETRNFERHRRDALAMERLTPSPYIVDIYAFCGNSVLTEYVGDDLYHILYSPDDENGSTQVYELSDDEKLRLSWEVAKSVADLHQVPGGPIVQADITAKQFLVDEQGHIKLNDFNRCRFMGHKEDTKEKCTFRVPSAPGRHRSPEEYEEEELTEQLDTYSTAHVLYGILTGKQPWDELPTSQIKRAVKHGMKPYIDEKYRQPGTPGALLASLIERAYEHDPEKRIRASEIVSEIDDYRRRHSKADHGVAFTSRTPEKSMAMRGKVN